VTTDRGLRVEVWLSTKEAKPGEWMQAVVRTTNVRSDTAWLWPAECDTSGTQVAVDLRPVMPAGEPQSRNAGAFKDQAIAAARILEQSFSPWDGHGSPLTGDGAVALAECTVASHLHPLAPGHSQVERFAWYPATSPATEGWADPLPAGTVSVHVHVPVLRRGARVPRKPTQPGCAG
jgi:hypothetical protein